MRRSLALRSTGGPPVPLGLAADATHLLVAVVGVDFGFQADAGGHGLGECGAARRAIGGGAEEGADVYFAAFEEAGSQGAVGGQAEAVAGGAEGGGHGADEADAACWVAVGELVDDGGAYA